MSGPPFAIRAQDGSLAFQVVGREKPEGPGAPQWLLANVTVELGGAGPLLARGQCALTVDDVRELVDVLARVGRPVIGSAGRVASWCTSDEEVELTFTVSDGRTALSGQVDVAGSFGDVHALLKDLAMTSADVERSHAEASAALERLATPART